MPPSTVLRTQCSQRRAPIVGDLHGDGVVNGTDLARLLANCGLDTNPSNCPADFNGDGIVNSVYLAILLSNWSGGDSDPGELGGTGVIGPDATGAAPQAATSSLPWLIEALGFDSVESCIG